MAKIKNNGLYKKKFVALEYHPMDSRISICDDDVCQTLNSRMGTGGNNVPLIMVVDDQGGKNISADKKNVSPTLRAQTHGHPPLVVINENDNSSDKHRLRKIRDD